MDINGLKNENASVAPVAASAAPAQENPNVGSKSDAVQLVAPIGNPLKPDVTPIYLKGADGKTVMQDGKPVRDGDKVLTKPTIVGYMFKATEDIEVPDFGIPTDLKKNRMGYENLTGSKLVKAGETFPLTLMEMAALASREEFNKHFGGEHPAVCVYLTKKGDAQIESGFYPAQLQLESGSIKNLDYEEICEVIETPDTMKGKDGAIRNITRRTAKDGAVKPGFEKFKSLVEVSAPGTRTSGPRAAASTAKVWDDSAKRFNELLRKKQAGAL